MKPHVICLVLDRLRASALGAYGAAWCETAALDRLASEARLFDQMYCSSLQLDRLYDDLWNGDLWNGDLWNGSSDLPARPEADKRPTLPAAFSEAGYRTSLLTDESVVAEHRLAESFGQRTLLPSPTPTCSAQAIEETGLARFFASAAETLRAVADSPDEPSLVWLHSRGMAAPWDAPWKMRTALAGAEDPEPPRGVEVPNVALAENADPDIRLGHTQSYTAQVTVLDACLEALLDQLDDSGLTQNSLLIVLGARGFALGEHGGIGLAGDRLYQECLHVPLLLRSSDGWQSLARSASLCCHGDLGSLLQDWLAATDSGEPLSEGMLARWQDEALAPLDHLRFSHGRERAIRTPAWFLRRADDESEPELYVKPDDRFEMNEVAVRCGAIVDGLVSALEADPLAPLASELTDATE